MRERRSEVIGIETDPHQAAPAFRGSPWDCRALASEILEAGVTNHRQTRWIGADSTPQMSRLPLRSGGCSTGCKNYTHSWRWPAANTI